MQVVVQLVVRLYQRDQLGTNLVTVALHTTSNQQLATSVACFNKLCNSSKSPGFQGVPVAGG